MKKKKLQEGWGEGRKERRKEYRWSKAESIRKEERKVKDGRKEGEGRKGQK